MSPVTGPSPAPAAGPQGKAYGYAACPASCHCWYVGETTCMRQALPSPFNWLAFPAICRRTFLVLGIGVPLQALASDGFLRFHLAPGKASGACLGAERLRPEEGARGEILPGPSPALLPLPFSAPLPAKGDGLPEGRGTPLARVALWLPTTPFCTWSGHLAASPLCRRALVASRAAAAAAPPHSSAYRRSAAQQPCRQQLAGAPLQAPALVA